MILAVLGFLLAFVGMILLICALVSIGKARSFSKCSESITGKVGNKYVHFGNNHRTYSLDILYSVDGIEYKRSVPASVSEYKTLEEGDPFEIKYRSDAPQKIIRLDSLTEQNEKNTRILLVTSVAMTVLGIALILIRLYTVRM